MHTLDVNHVTKRYGKATVVDDMTFSVRPGRVTGFLGPNGAGKSTTMKVMLDLAAAEKGTATIGGVRYRDLDDPARTVGVVLEPNAFHPGRSGRDHLNILVDATGAPRSRIEETLDLVDLGPAADRNAGTYSLGMRQRLGIAAALLLDPPVLVLDEPGNGLDPQGIRWLRDLLRDRAHDGSTVFVSSHLLAEMEHLADDLIVINRGKLVTSGSMAELRQAGSWVRTPNPEPLVGALEAAGADVQRRDDGGLAVRGMSTADIGDLAHRTGVALHELSTMTGSLEDLFLSWTGAQGAAPAPERGVTSR